MDWRVTHMSIMPVIFNDIYTKDCVDIAYVIEKVDPYSSSGRIELVISTKYKINDFNTRLSREQMKELNLKSTIKYAFGKRIPLHNSSILAMDFDDKSCEDIKIIVDKLKTIKNIKQIDIVTSSQILNLEPTNWHIHCGLCKSTNTFYLLKIFEEDICPGYLSTCINTMQQVIRLSEKFNVDGDTKIRKVASYILEDNIWKKYTSDQLTAHSTTQDVQSVNTTEIQEPLTFNIRKLLKKQDSLSLRI